MFHTFTHSVIRLAAALIITGGVSLSAYAFPIAVPGTEGLKVIATGGEIIATYEGNSASFSNDLYLDSTFIFNNHATPVGTSVSLGTFVAGTELVFRMHVNDTGDDFFTGEASRNLDGHEHARVQSDWLPHTTLVSFEDLYNGPFDYNDLSFSFTNTIAAVPEPETYAMLLAGLGLVGFFARRRKQNN
ncbi:MAG: PEP-CTERM sorting domain-containing protein [Proteobacteria bacterium]|jgi:hypothetical protein|nr:PEP-CTERM sorting domain-containing protein [Pseudomonadota bacterium]